MPLYLIVDHTLVHPGTLLLQGGNQVVMVVGEDAEASRVHCTELPLKVRGRVACSTAVQRYLLSLVEKVGLGVWVNHQRGHLHRNCNEMGEYVLDGSTMVMG